MIPGFRYTIGGGRGRRRGGRRANRLRRLARAATQGARRVFGEGGTQEETAREVLAEAGRAARNRFRRRRNR